MTGRLTIEVSDYALEKLEEIFRDGLVREGLAKVATLPDSDGNTFEIAFKPKAPEKEEKKRTWKKSSPSKTS
jgi:hypothetical protein